MASSAQPPPPAPTLPQLLTSLTTASAPSLPAPHPSFIAPLLTSSRSMHLAALTATARHRITASDISLPQILSPDTACLPARIGDKTVVSTALREDVFVQVLEVEDIGRGKWDQVEQLESERKGETTKGREVIRVVNVDNDEERNATSTQAPPHSTSTQTHAAPNPPSRGPFKLLLQDHAGTKVWAFELRRVEKIGYPPVMGIGCKLWLKKGAKVARGMVLLEPAVVQVVGGRIEGLDKAWREGREARLREWVKRDAAAAGVTGGRGEE